MTFYLRRINVILTSQQHQPSSDGRCFIIAWVVAATLHCDVGTLFHLQP